MLGSSPLLYCELFFSVRGTGVGTSVFIAVVLIIVVPLTGVLLTVVIIIVQLNFRFRYSLLFSRQVIRCARESSLSDMYKVFAALYFLGILARILSRFFFSGLTLSRYIP